MISFVEWKSNGIHLFEPELSLYIETYWQEITDTAYVNFNCTMNRGMGHLKFSRR